MNFAILPKNVNYTEHMLTFELLYWDVNSLEASNLDKNFIQGTNFIRVLFHHTKTMGKNLPKMEFDALKILFKNKDIKVDTKADKGDKVVRKRLYKKRLEKIMQDEKHFE